MERRKTIPRLKFLCFGAGAIGTYIGGSLLKSGQQVVFIEHPSQVEKLKQSGLKLDIGGEITHLKNPAIVASLEEALTQGPFDVAIVAVKSFDTPALIETLKPYRAALPALLSFQNGVENEALLAKELGAERIISGTVTTAIGKSGTGSVILEKLRGVGVASGHPLSSPLVAVLSAAGLNAVEYADAESMKWSKMFTNLPANAASAIMDLTAAEIYSHRGLCHLEIRMLSEMLQVMKTLGIPLTDLPGTPVKALGFLVRSLPEFISQPLLNIGLGKARGDKMPSFHIDLHSGRKNSEVGYLNGAVERFGHEAGIKTPVNRFLTQTLSALVSGDMDIQTYQKKPQAFLDAFAAFEIKER
jgi:2-dehydropantoate 2-reductase